jgi:hypothetical protein
MRIEVSVPGVRRQRGKLPAPTTTRTAEARITARSLTADLLRAGQSSAVRASDWQRGWHACRIGHPVNTETIKSMTIRLRQ